MLFIWILSVFIVQTHPFQCDFDYGLECLRGLPTTSGRVLNATSDTTRLPASDVTAIETSNEEGTCYFPYQFSSFEMHFCARTSPELPSTCPTFNATGPLLNCSEGEYGYETFENGDVSSRAYQLNFLDSVDVGRYCLRFFYFFSDNNANASIKVQLEYEETNNNYTIGSVQPSSPLNRWNEARLSFDTHVSVSRIFFVFTCGNSNISPFYIAIDEIQINDVYCEPNTIPTTTTASLVISTQSTPIPPFGTTPANAGTAPYATTPGNPETASPVTTSANAETVSSATTPDNRGTAPSATTPDNRGTAPSATAPINPGTAPPTTTTTNPGTAPPTTAPTNPGTAPPTTAPINPGTAPPTTTAAASSISMDFYIYSRGLTLFTIQMLCGVFIG